MLSSVATAVEDSAVTPARSMRTARRPARTWFSTFQRKVVEHEREAVLVVNRAHPPSSPLCSGRFCATSRARDVAARRCGGTDCTFASP